MFVTSFAGKLYLAGAFLVVLTAVAIGFLTHGQLERTLLQEKETSLRHQCVGLAPLVAPLFESDYGGDAVALVKRIAGDTGTRVTLITPSGIVLADTDEDIGRMDNHIGRVEVQEAIAREFGVSMRDSATVGRGMFYVAHVPGRDAAGHPLGVVRLSIPTDDIDEQLASMRRRLVLGAGFGTLAALGLLALVARRITAPLGDLTVAAERLARGDYDARVQGMPSGEIGVLGDAFNRLADELRARIDALSSEKAQLRAMLAGMVEGVVAIDADDRVAFSNRAARDLLAEPDLEGRRLWEVVRIGGLDELVDEARSSDQAARRELVFGGDRREIALSAEAHRFRGERADGIVIVLHDITEVRRLERIRRDFVANVSHELKTPLTSIRGYVETLLDGALYDAANNERFLEKIDANVGRLNHLVADLLTLARVEEQERGPSLVRVDVRPLVCQAVRLREGAAAGKSISCVVEGDDGPLWVRGDQESLVQVIDNLIDNAIKYTPEGGRVTLALAERGGAALLEVRDTGVGIPPDDLERIFERFYRVDKARSRELGGTGLGLSIVKHLVGAMQGEVGVESKPGEGSTFWVRLNLA